MYQVSEKMNNEQYDQWLWAQKNIVTMSDDVWSCQSFLLLCLLLLEDSNSIFPGTLTKIIIILATKQDKRWGKKLRKNGLYEKLITLFEIELKFEIKN